VKNDLQSKKLFLLDMDGTIYLDHDVFPETIPFLNAVKQKGARYLYLTNNASKSVNAYVDKLASMGIEADADEFLTSTDATVLFLKKHYSKEDKIYAFGTASFREQIAEAGFSVVTELSDDVKLLLMGFDTELTFKKLEDACILLNRGVDYVATNPDIVCPTWYGSVPDCGSIANILEAATGRRPRFIGKPNPEMLLLAVEKAGLKKSDAVMIGDRLYTDIASGVNAGIDTVFVLSGEGTLKDLEKSDKKPTFVMKNVGEVMNAFLGK
jgi:HAD superfamily hydrolase (TIGR01457 family)